MLLLWGWWQIITGHNRSRQENRSKPFLYRHNNRNLVWNSGPSQTWSQTFSYLAPCGHTHTHTSSLTSFTCVNSVNVTLEVCSTRQCCLQHVSGAHGVPIMTNHSFHWSASGGLLQLRWGRRRLSDAQPGDRHPFHSTKAVYFITIFDLPSSRARKQTLIWHFFIFTSFVWQLTSHLWCFDVRVFTFSTFQVSLDKHKEGPTSVNLNYTCKQW